MPSTGERTSASASPRERAHDAAEALAAAHRHPVRGVRDEEPRDLGVQVVDVAVVRDERRVRRRLELEVVGEHAERRAQAWRIPITTCSAKTGVTRMPTPISTTRHGTPLAFRLCAMVFSSTVLASWTQIRSRFMRARERHELVLEGARDPHLRDLAQVDVARVDVDHERRAGERAHRGVRRGAAAAGPRAWPGKLRFRSTS